MLRIAGRSPCRLLNRFSKGEQTRIIGGRRGLRKDKLVGKDKIEIYVLIPKDHQQPSFLICNGCSQNKCHFLKVGKKEDLEVRG